MFELTGMAGPFTRRMIALTTAALVALTLAVPTAATAIEAPAAQDAAADSAPLFVEGPATVTPGEQLDPLPNGWMRTASDWILAPATVSPAVPTSFAIVYLHHGVEFNRSELGTSEDGRFRLFWSDQKIGTGDGVTVVFEATNAAGTTRSDAARVAPVFATQPADVTGADGSSVTLSASLESAAGTTVTWFVDGQQEPLGTGETITVTITHELSGRQFWAVAANWIGAASTQKATFSIAAAGEVESFVEGGPGAGDEPEPGIESESGIESEPGAESGAGTGSEAGPESEAEATPGSGTDSTPENEQSVPAQLPPPVFVQGPVRVEQGEVTAAGWGSAAAQVIPAGPTSFWRVYLDRGVETERQLLGNSADGTFKVSWYDAPSLKGHGASIVFEATNSGGSTRSDAPRSAPVFTVQPSNVTAPDGVSVTLSAELANPVGVTVAWFVEGREEPLGTGLHWTQPMSAELAGKQFWAVASAAAGETASAKATFTRQSVQEALALLILKNMLKPAPSTTPSPSPSAVPPQPVAAKPVIAVQPQHAVGTVNSPVTLSLELSGPTVTSVTWYTRNDAGESVPFASGLTPTVTLVPWRDGKPFWAEVTNPGGTVVSAQAIFAIVKQPVIKASLRSALTLADGQTEAVAIAADGGYPGVARVVPFIVRVGSGSGTFEQLGGRLDSRVDVGEGNSLRTDATATFGLKHFGGWTVVWKTCVIVPASTLPCAVEVPGATTNDSIMPVQELRVPKVMNLMRDLTIAEPGKSVTLSIKAESPTPVSYLWEYSEDGKHWKTAVRSDSSAYNVANASAADGRWYRVTASNAAGPAESFKTQIRAMTSDYSRPGEGFSPVTFVNLTTDSDGNQPLTLVGSSGAWEVPSGYLVLPTGAEVKTSWHWRHGALNEWFDLQIGDTGWSVRVRYLFAGVDCRFFKNGQTERAAGRTAPSVFSEHNPLFACVNGSGDNSWLGRGTPDDKLVLKLVNKAPVALKDDAAQATLASYACSSEWVTCGFEGTAEPGPMQVTQVHNPGMNCSPAGTGLASFTLTTQVTRWKTFTWNNYMQTAVGWEFKLGDPKTKTLTARVGSYWEHNEGGTRSEVVSDAHTTTVLLAPGQVGYMAVNTPTTIWRGSTVVSMGGQNYHAGNVAYTTNDPEAVKVLDTSVDGPNKLAVATFQRPMTPAELGSCRSDIASAPQLTLPSAETTEKPRQLRQPVSKTGGPGPDITRQPYHAVGVANAEVTLSLTTPATDAEVRWYYEVDGLRKVLAVGNDQKIRLTPSLHGHEFWAEVTDSTGTTTSERAILAVVAKPQIVVPLRTAPLYVAPDGLEEVTIAAEGGYAQVATVVPYLIKTDGSRMMPAKVVHRPGDAGDRVFTDAVAQFDVTRKGDWTVIWKTCVLVPDSTDPCPIEVPGASSGETVPPVTLSVTDLEAPRIVDAMRELTTALPGNGVSLTVETTEPQVPLTYEWQYSLDGKLWRVASVQGSPTYEVANVSAVDGRWYRVKVSNAAGSTLSPETQVRAMQRDYSLGIDGFAPLVFANLTTDRDGNQPLTLTRWSGAEEIPAGYLVLATGAEVSTSWHFNHAALNEWFEMRIGDSIWNVRVHYWFNGVECVFFRSGEEALSTSALKLGYALGLYPTPPFSCVNGAGDGAYVARGTADDQSVLTLVDNAPVKVDDQYLSRLAGYACSSERVLCALEGTSEPGPVRIQQKSKSYTNCSPPGEGAIASHALTLQTQEWNQRIWSNIIGATAGFDVGIVNIPGLISMGFSFKEVTEHSEGGMRTKVDTKTFISTLNVSPGQAGYLAVYTPTTRWTGDVVISMGGQTYRADGLNYLTTETGSAETFDVNQPHNIHVATFTRPASQLELESCRAGIR